MSQTLCHHCQQPVDPDSPRTWRRIKGWERRASKHSSRRGGSDIVLRQPVDTFACDFCVSQLRNGRAPTQGALL